MKTKCDRRGMRDLEGQQSCGKCFLDDRGICNTSHLRDQTSNRAFQLPEYQEISIPVGGETGIYLAGNSVLMFLRRGWPVSWRYLFFVLDRTLMVGAARPVEMSMDATNADGIRRV